MQLGTDIFCTSLRELPVGLSAEYHYPGIFGLEFTTSKNRAAWEQRIAVNGQFFPEFSKICILFPGYQIAVAPFGENGYFHSSEPKVKSNCLTDSQSYATVTCV